MSAITSEYRGKQALRLLSARTDSDRGHALQFPLDKVEHVDRDGTVSTVSEADMMWHVIDNVAHWDIDKVVLFTHGYCWNLELWQESKANPAHVFRIPK